MLQAVTDTNRAVETPSTDANDASLQQTADVQEAQQQLAELQEGQQQPSNKKVRLVLAAEHAVNSVLLYSCDQALFTFMIIMQSKGYPLVTPTYQTMNMLLELFLLPVTACFC